MDVKKPSAIQQLSCRRKMIFIILVIATSFTPLIILNYTLTIVERRVMEFEMWFQVNASVDHLPDGTYFYLRVPEEDRPILIESIFYSNKHSFDFVFCSSDPSYPVVIRSIRANRFERYFLEFRLISAVGGMSKIEVVEANSLFDAQSHCSD